MTNEAFDKWLKEHYPDYPPFPQDVWQAAKANSEREIVELKAHINDLHDALKDIATDADGCCNSGYSAGFVARNALSKTPAQSLQEHDNELLEKCAKVCENIITGDDAEFYTDAFAKAIREMKGK